MKSLGKILRGYIRESGYTIYKAAGSAGVNRTTLQKILADERSASEEFLHKLLPILKLSSDEEAEVWKFFEISQTGEAIYQQRQSIKNMIESIAGLDCFFYPGSFGLSDSSARPHSKLYNVQSELYAAPAQPDPYASFCPPPPNKK